VQEDRTEIAGQQIRLGSRILSSVGGHARSAIEIPEDDRKSQMSWDRQYRARIAAGGFAVFFGGSWTDGLVAAVIGVLIMVFTLYTPAKVNGTLKTFVTAFVAGVAALGACRFVPYTSPGEIMIGTIMLMIPGLALGTSLRDLFGGDMVSGLLRFVQALFTAAIIAAGYGLAWLTIGGVL
jgi:uncharacterized membrane protein YjjP (DUF1212 family)